MTAQEFFCNVWLAGISLKRLPAPKSKTFIPRSPSLQRLNRCESSWVFYKMRLKGICQSDIARVSGMANSTVSEVLNGKKSSLRVYAAVSSLLGYTDIDSLLSEARRSAA